MVRTLFIKVQINYYKLDIYKNSLGIRPCFEESSILQIYSAVISS